MRIDLLPWVHVPRRAELILVLDELADRERLTDRRAESAAVYAAALDMLEKGAERVAYDALRVDGNAGPT